MNNYGFFLKAVGETPAAALEAATDLLGLAKAHAGVSAIYTHGGDCQMVRSGEQFPAAEPAAHGSHDDPGADPAAGTDEKGSDDD